jgi:hypothetical protein
LRGAALNALVGVGDSYGGDGSQHNVQFYVRANDGKVLYFPHDLDAFFAVDTSSRPIVPNNELSKLISNPAYARAYYGHLLDIIATTYNGSYMTRWADHFGRLLPAQNFASHLSFIVQRAANVTTAVNAAVASVAFAITNNNGNNFATTNSFLALAGNAPLAVKSIRVNGVDYAITWTTTTAWRITVPLFSGTNLLSVQGFDRNNLPLSTALDTITVTNDGPAALLPVVINEWMADNAGPDGFADPVDGLFQDWFELFNPNTNAVNLGGFFLTDNLQQPTKWRVPPGTIISSLGFLLVWADNQTNQNGLGPYGDLHAGFQLNNDGEELGLFAPNGVEQSRAIFGRQTQNVSEGLYVDGNVGGGHHFMTNFTPRLPNSLAGPLKFIEISVNLGGVGIRWNTAPGRTYQIEFKDRLSDETWTPLGNEITAVDSTASIVDNSAAGSQRFYRVLLVR